CLNHLLTAAAGLLRAGDLDDLELCRDHLEDLAHVLADQAQLTAAIGAGVAEIELAALARRVCRDAGSPRWARRGVRVGGSGREIRVGIVLIACYGGLLCDGDEHVFERELKLCGNRPIEAACRGLM